ncbi:MAG: amidase family protein, partial [Verrucomicrobiota bacterium]
MHRQDQLDQFATGLVGTRSPHGAPSCVFDDAYISGGSSSGSAVAVAAGLVSFALGTDTAGSGRVPAGFNNLVGWKPTRGLLSNTGLVPACRSLDCISVFTLTCADAQTVGGVVSRFDATDAYSRRAPAPTPDFRAGFKFGVPPAAQLEFFGDTAAAALFEKAAARLESIGGVRVEIDFAPFKETADLLYSGPWVAERLSAVQAFRDKHPGALWPTTEKIISGGANYDAVSTFRSFYRLEELRRVAEAEWAKMDV